jgi:hypothetical protein
MLRTLPLLPMLSIDAKLPMLKSDAALATLSTLANDRMDQRLRELKRLVFMNAPYTRTDASGAPAVAHTRLLERCPDDGDEHNDTRVDAKHDGRDRSRWPAVEHGEANRQIEQPPDREHLDPAHHMRHEAV